MCYVVPTSTHGMMATVEKRELICGTLAAQPIVSFEACLVQWKVNGKSMERLLKLLSGLNAFVAHCFQVMSAIDWLPKRNGCVGVAAVKNVDFDDRVQLSGKARTLQQLDV